MRARNIKPDFYRDAELVECSCQARYIVPGLWMMADREGRLKDKPKQIKMQLFPCDDWDCEALLTELADARHIIRYEVDGQRFIQIRNFTEHQKCHPNEPASTLPGITNQNQSGKLKSCNVIPCHEHSCNVTSDPADILNADILNAEKKHLPSSPPQNSGKTEAKSFSSPAATDGRLKRPLKGKKATTDEWVNALGNGLRSWFEQEWWPEQLRKVGKKECAIAIHELNPDEDLRHQMLSAYIRQRDAIFSRREVDKVPHPATWVNGCRWEDDASGLDPYGIEE